MKSVVTISAWLLTVGLVAQSQGQSIERLEKRAVNLLPSKGQLRFQEIPWVHDLVEAQTIAQAERRPMFLWGYGGRARPDIALEGC